MSRGALSTRIVHRSDLQTIVDNDSIRLETVKVVAETGDAASIEMMKEAQRERAYEEIGRAIVKNVEPNVEYVLKVNESVYRQHTLPGIDGTPTWTLEVIARLLKLDGKPIFYTVWREAEGSA